MYGSSRNRTRPSRYFAERRTFGRPVSHLVSVRLRRCFVALCCIGSAFLAGCAPDAPPAEGARTVTDALGREIRLERPVERVLTLAPNLTELLFAAGTGEKLAGVSPSDDFPPGLDSLPAYSTFPLDIERVVALRPDLVLATDQVNNPRDADALARAGIPTYFFRFTAVADVPRALRTIGALVGAEAQADAAADSLERRLEALAARTEGLRRPRTLLLIGDTTPFAFGGASYTQEVIRLAGGESLTAGFAGEGVTLQDEWVLQARPEVIVGAFGPDYDPQRLVHLHPSWRAVPAVQEGRIYSMDPDLLVRPGPRLVEGAERLARLLHPELGESEEWKEIGRVGSGRGQASRSAPHSPIPPRLLSSFSPAQ